LGKEGGEYISPLFSAKRGAGGELGWGDELGKSFDIYVMYVYL